MKANLEEANSQGAILSGANLKTDSMDGINLKRTILCETKLPWGIDNSGCPN